MNKDFLALLDAYLTDRISPEDQASFFEMLEQPAHKALLEEVIDRLAIAQSLVGETYPGMRDASFERLKLRLQEDNLLHKEPVAPAKLKIWRRKNIRWAAAVVAGAVLLGFLWQRQASTNQQLAIKYPDTSSITHIAGGATLTLSDGSVVQLDSLRNGTQLKQNGTQVIMADNSLAYDPTDKQTNSIIYNTISTSRGKQFMLVLPDGSKVWLNASSRLRFPTSFPSHARQVELEGEAYFEVASQASAPFSVTMGANSSVEVLGTHFNIRAYQDEQEIATTLLEGAVSVHNNNQQVVLKPGQQAIGINTTLEVKETDPSTAIAWKNGRFEFYGSIKDIMNQLQRWYDIDTVAYEGNVGNRALAATIARSQPLSTVLDLLQKTGSIHFKTEGKKIIVMP